MRLKGFSLGASSAILGRALIPGLLLLKFRNDVKKLNSGDHSSLLAAYADDFVLHFNKGEHRWSGDWVGKAAMDRFLQNFTAARIQGEIRQVAISGPPWALTMWARFDDHADAPDGARIYENRTVLVLRTRWGKIVEQDDFYIDTAPIAALEHKLTELGIEAIPKPS
ncbi:MAG: nuclear transport factor 2 family protein [Solirubrobacteraceae bacterium]